MFHGETALRHKILRWQVCWGMAGGVLRVTLSGFIFVVTGLVQTVCVQALLYSGGGDRSTLLIALPNYAGIFLVYVIGQHAFRALDSLGVWEARGADRNRVHVPLYGKDGGIGERSNMKRVAVPFTLQSLRDGLAKFFHPERRKLFILAFNELGGFITGIIGLSIAGSGLYQVVFSGGTVFTALLSVFFLRRRLALSQWVFVAVITLGLTVTAEQVTHPSNSHTGEDANAASIISGVSFVLVSCLFYSTNYVIAEHFLDVREQVETDLDEAPPELPPPSGVDLSLYTGGTCLFIFGLYVLLHTVPHWHELVTLSIERHRGNAAIIVEQYCYLAIAAFLHGITYYDIVATVGGKFWYFLFAFIC